MENQSLLIIKPLSISRGDGPSILRDCLHNTHLALSRFREWTPCVTTMDVMGDQAEKELFPLPKRSPIWTCLFTSLNPDVDAHQTLITLWKDTSLLSPRRRYKQGIHPSDTLVRITDPSRLQLETDLLF